MRHKDPHFKEEPWGLRVTKSMILQVETQYRLTDSSVDLGVAEKQLGWIGRIARLVETSCVPVFWYIHIWTYVDSRPFSSQRFYDSATWFE